MKQRDAQGLTAEPLDMLIVGGGIVGAGIARDAALRQMQVGLVEQHDFASGTSSRTSRLLHGGLRYLEQGRIGLVREASREKLIVQNIAPHLCSPMTFTFPAYHHERFSLWKLKLGVKIYDKLCGTGNFAPSESFDINETIHRNPLLKMEQLAGSVEYADAQTLDSRLVLDTLTSAQNAGARLFNYIKLISAQPDGNLWICEIEDRLTQEPHTVKTRTLINATGPWAEKFEHSGVKIHPTKGVHLVFPKDALPTDKALVLPARNRILFALPWGERTVLGTTDTDFPGDLANPKIREEDIEYLLQFANTHLQGVDLTPDTILSGWAGVRPLVATKHQHASDISRKHTIRTSKNGWWDVAGGKLTTYRLIAEQTVDQVIDFLELRKRECKTADRPLLKVSEPPAFSKIIPGEIDLELVDHYCENEWAQHLDDILLRRTAWGHYWPYDDSSIQAVADRMSQHLDWSPEQRKDEIDAYHALRPDVFET